MKSIAAGPLREYGRVFQQRQHLDGKPFQQGTSDSHGLLEFSEASLSFFSLVFSKIPRKTLKTARIFLALRTLKTLKSKQKHSQRPRNLAGNKNTTEKKDRLYLDEAMFHEVRKGADQGDAELFSVSHWAPFVAHISQTETLITENLV